MKMDYKFPTIEEMAHNVAEKALDEIMIEEKTIREWVAIIVTQTLCEDTISRQSVIEVISKYDFSYPEYMERFVTELRDAMQADLVDDIKSLPSVTPIRSTGRWIRDTITDLYHCSCCMAIVRQDPKNKDDYCRWCGAKMTESEEQA